MDELDRDGLKQLIDGLILYVESKPNDWSDLVLTIANLKADRSYLDQQSADLMAERTRLRRILADTHHVLYPHEGTISDDEMGGINYTPLPKAVAGILAEVNVLERTVSFFASVIKSGEPWSPECEEALRAALGDEEDGL